MRKRPFTNADDLLKELVIHNDHLGEYVDGLYSPRDEVDGTYLNALFGQLRDQDMISCFYADNIAYFVTINPKGFAHAQQLDKLIWRKAKSMFDPLHGQLREDLLKIQELYPTDSVIPNNSELSESIRLLKTKGYLPMFERFVDGSWGVTYSYDDLNYLALEEDYIASRDKQVVSLKVEGENNLVNFANGNSAIHSSQSIGVDARQLSDLISELRKYTQDFSSDEKQKFEDWTETIKSELANPKPKKSVLETGMSIIKALSNSVKFAAAFAALAQFVQLSIQ